MVFANWIVFTNGPLNSSVVSTNYYCAGLEYCITGNFCSDLKNSGKSCLNKFYFATQHRGIVE